MHFNATFKWSSQGCFSYEQRSTRYAWCAVILHCEITLLTTCMTVGLFSFFKKIMNAFVFPVFERHTGEHKKLPLYFSSQFSLEVNIKLSAGENWTLFGLSLVDSTTECFIYLLYLKKDMVNFCPWFLLLSGWTDGDHSPVGPCLTVYQSEWRHMSPPSCNERLCDIREHLWKSKHQLGEES